MGARSSCMHGQQLQELCLETKNWVYKAKLEECTNPRRALHIKKIRTSGLFRWQNSDCGGSNKKTITESNVDLGVGTGNVYKQGIECYLGLVVAFDNPNGSF